MMKLLLNASTRNAIAKLVDRANNIVITCHKTPDGDAVGSTLALCRVLRNMGKYVDVVSPDMVPRSLQFVPMVNQITPLTHGQGNRANALVSRADLIFCLDYNSFYRLDRLGQIIEKSQAPRILIDHHLNPDHTFDVMVSYPELSSTCEITYRVIMEMGWGNFFDRTSAQYIFLGMMTDTGNFTYSSEYPEVYQVLSQLMAYNINKQDIYNKAMNTFAESSLRIQGYAIAHKMQLFPEQGCALIVLNKEELERYGYRRGDTEGLVNKPLSIPGIYWTMFLRQDPESVKVSCRSVGDFSVSNLCRDYFGGGGHMNAAGGDFFGSIEDATARAIEIIKSI